MEFSFLYVCIKVCGDFYQRIDPLINPQMSYINWMLKAFYFLKNIFELLFMIYFQTKNSKIIKLILFFGC
jgi:hypothetical protein